MVPLEAEFRTEPAGGDARRRTRRTLRLEVPALASGDAAPALVHNLSEKGLLIETAAALQVGDMFDVELPEAGVTPARVIWTRDLLVGCEFVRPVSKGAVSAALLLTPVERERIEPAASPARPYSRDFEEYESDTEGSRVVVMISLFLAFFAVVLFVLALLSFPFSA